MWFSKMFELANLQAAMALEPYDLTYLVVVSPYPSTTTPGVENLDSSAGLCHFSGYLQSLLSPVGTFPWTKISGGFKRLVWVSLVCSK